MINNNEDVNSFIVEGIKEYTDDNMTRAGCRVDRGDNKEKKVGKLHNRLNPHLHDFMNKSEMILGQLSNQRGENAY